MLPVRARHSLWCQTVHCRNFEKPLTPGVAFPSQYRSWSVTVTHVLERLFSILWQWKRSSLDVCGLAFWSAMFFCLLLGAHRIVLPNQTKKVKGSSRKSIGSWNYWYCSSHCFILQTVRGSFWFAYDLGGAHKSNLTLRLASFCFL